MAGHEELLDAAKNEIYKFDNPLDKIKFLNFLLDRNNRDYEEHKLQCKDPEICSKNFEHENIAYFLSQDLRKLGVQFDDDTFTLTEKQNTESKLDQILKDLSEVKLGQKIIYDDLYKEIEELKELFFLGKKKWYQLLVGKSVDMVASGVMSETISKQLIEGVKEGLRTAIGYI